MDAYFYCDKCGLCCKNVCLSEKTAFLDKGDGICRYFDEMKNLCLIYEDRPYVCRVDDYYAEVSKIMSLENYYSLNTMSCTLLKMQKIIPVKKYT